MKTPCIHVCILDPDGSCIGCARTIDEIVGWASMSDAERDRIITTLNARKRARLSGDAVTSTESADA